MPTASMQPGGMPGLRVASALRQGSTSPQQASMASAHRKDASLGTWGLEGGDISSSKDVAVPQALQRGLHSDKPAVICRAARTSATGLVGLGRQISARTETSIIALSPLQRPGKLVQFGMHHLAAPLPTAAMHPISSGWCQSSACNAAGEPRCTAALLHPAPQALSCTIAVSPSVSPVRASQEGAAALVHHRHSSKVASLLPWPVAPSAPSAAGAQAASCRAPGSTAVTWAPSSSSTPLAWPPLPMSRCRHRRVCTDRQQHKTADLELWQHLLSMQHRRARPPWHLAAQAAQHLPYLQHGDSRVPV